MTLVDAETTPVVTSMLALVEPAVTNTLCGIVTRLLADASETVTPPAGAAVLSVTTARVAVPPTIDAAFSASAESNAVADGGFTGESQPPARSAAETRDERNALRSLMIVLLIAVRAS